MTITSVDIQDSTIQGTEIKNYTITQFDIAIGGVTSSSILDGTITGADIQADALGTDQIADIYVLNTSDQMTGTLWAAQFRDYDNDTYYIDPANSSYSARLYGDLIVGDGIDWDDDVSLARATIQNSLQKVDDGHGVLIFTDMFGGTPTNISLTFLEPGRTEIVTGINLPMLIKFLNLRTEEDLAAVVEQICQKGRRSIQVASELLGRHTTRAGKE